MVPPNIPLTVEDIQDELDRRKPGQSRYVTQRKEDDVSRFYQEFLKEKQPEPHRANN